MCGADFSFMKMTLQRVIVFWALVIAIGVALSTYWQRMSGGERWLYSFERPARAYAVSVLNAMVSQGAVPEELTSNSIAAHDTYVTFTPNHDPDLIVAFSPDRPPPAAPGGEWRSLRKSGWYEWATPRSPE